MEHRNAVRLTCYMQNLASFVRTHERGLANALQSHRQRSKDGQQQTTAGASSNASSLPTSISLSEAVSKPYLPFFSQKITPAKLALTPHHLFYLLSKFEELGVDIGPMNVRLENLQHNAPSNYISFLGHAPKSRGRQADETSLKSVSSVRSVMSSVSSLWSNMTITSSATKIEKQMTQYREDIRYLYSCFTKIPALKLSPDHRARLVAGFEEFPFDTAVPLFAFKNVSALEISDLDFRQFYGWDRLAEQLRSLTVRRANVDDPIDLLQHIVLDDMEKRRKRSFKIGLPATPSTPGAPWPTNSPTLRHIELARTMSAPSPPYIDSRPGSKTGSSNAALERKDSSDVNSSSTKAARDRSTSPPRPTSKQGARPKHMRNGSAFYRRSSGSSASSSHDMSGRRSSTDLLSLTVLPPSKWRFLRHLSLAENGLHTLTGVSLAPVADTLQSLDLAGNLFSDIPDALATLTHLRALNLSNCMIDSLHSLARNPLPAITTLNLRSNRLISLSGIERLISLERVDLRDNRIRDPTELARLSAFPDLTEVYVIKNPFARTHANYRVTVFNIFRKTPGRVQDIVIDSLGPVYNEKRQLIDRVPEPASIPVVKPPTEDDEDPPETEPDVSAASEVDAVAERDMQEPSQRRGHRRATSDFGPHGTRKSKKAPRRRVIELTSPESPARLDLSRSHNAPPDSGRNVPRTPTDSDQPSTPEQTPYHTAPTMQVAASTFTSRPTLGPAFESPTPVLKIRDSSDDDEDDDNLRSEISPELGNSIAYRQKLEALKSDAAGPWLSALKEERAGNEHSNRIRSFSPSSRSSTIRADEQAARAAGVTGRTLG